MFKEIAVDELGDAYYSSPNLSFKLSEYVSGLPDCSGESLLRTRGIFGVTNRRNKAADRLRFRAYGLTLDDFEWVHVELDVNDTEYGVLTMLPLCMPEDFVELDLSYRRLFNLLGKAVERWMHRRKRMFHRALSLHQRFVLERELIDQLQSNLKKD